MGVDDAPQFIGQQFGQLIPGHLDVFVGATLVAGAGALPQPAAAHRRRGHAGLVPDGTRNVLQQRGGV
ncbi:Uncharacterised protein [Mycobacteroides abscessus]|nr:Uncharacterised protein [Mycobacteroides abscessus]